jgi:DNA polymerase III epsilon subunit-like protein
MSHRLTDLCERYGVALDRPHDALADAEATAAVLPHLLLAHGVHDADQLAALPSVR